jgi:hypothetical protein
MLHCFYKALETSGKGKLAVSLMLIRKPLQESLFVLESIVADRTNFAYKLTRLIHTHGRDSLAGMV